MIKPTAEQRERARLEAQRVLDRVMGRLVDEDVPETIVKEKKKYKKSVPRELRNGAWRPGVGRTNETLILKLYKDGMRISEIERELGIHSTTIRNCLKWHGVWSPAETTGPRRLERCKNGHDMSEHGRPVKSGGRYCALCKSERGKRAYLASKENN